MNALRQELIDAQKTRFQLLQWKLFLVSILAGTGLGFTGVSAVPNSELVLCCIPLACLYADALAYHQAMITHVIGEFLRKTDLSSTTPAEMRAFAEYENFSVNARRLEPSRFGYVGAYDLDKLTVHIASIFFSALVALSPLMISSNYKIFVVGSGIFGILATVFLRKAYNYRRKLLRPDA